MSPITRFLPYRPPPLLWAAALCLLCQPVLALEPMSDAELDAVTAGAAPSSDLDEIVAFDLVRRTQSGRTVTAEGSLSALTTPADLRLGQLTLSDGAQSHLQSVVNINAVDSVVNVLLNLNVTVDSTVGGVNQFNLNGALPPLPAAVPAP